MTSLLIVTPAPRASLLGNRISAERWADQLREQGHEVLVAEGWRGEAADVLIALHARKSYPAVRAWTEQRKGAPVVVVMTGTDLYRDIHEDEDAQRALALASRIVVLQERGLEELPAEVRDKARVIVQSAVPPDSVESPANDCFEVTVVGHLRPVKDPFRAAEAARDLPASSRVRVLQVGTALSPEMEGRARAEEERNERYRWLGERSRAETLRILARSRLTVSSSHMEGGANSIVEAIAAGVPVLASRISGTLGLLGPDHPGYFEVGDTRALTGLLQRAETDPEFLAALARSGARARELVSPDREREAWHALLAELVEEPPMGNISR